MVFTPITSNNIRFVGNRRPLFIRDETRKVNVVDDQTANSGTASARVVSYSTGTKKFWFGFLIDNTNSLIQFNRTAGIGIWLYISSINLLGSLSFLFTIFSQSDALTSSDLPEGYVIEFLISDGSVQESVSIKKVENDGNIILLSSENFSFQKDTWVEYRAEKILDNIVVKYNTFQYDATQDQMPQYVDILSIMDNSYSQGYMSFGMMYQSCQAVLNLDYLKFYWYG